MNEEVGLLTALTAGLISFVSPCVLPVVPAYLSYISGLSVDELRGMDGGGASAAGAGGGAPAGSAPGPSRRQRVFANSLAFVLGFSSVFILLGASASVVGQFLQQYASILTKVAGVVIILFGLNTLGLIRIPFLSYEKRFQANTRGASLVGSFVVGLAFAFGWTPCIGPILGAILGLASTAETVGKGVLLLTAYSLGLGIPFLLAALSVDSFFKVSSGVKKRFRVVEIFSGVLMVAIGALIFFNQLTWLSMWLSKIFPKLAELG